MTRQYVTQGHGAAARRQEIARLISLGLTLESVAAQFGVTRERIRQIATRELGGGVRTLRPWSVGPRPPVDHDARQVRRFWIRFRPDENGCWIWTGAMYPTGYGHVNQGGELYSHRLAYKLVKGAIPDGLTIDHLCRVRACGNPDHLEAVASRTNVLRGVGMGARNARKTHCIRGHGFTPENTRTSQASNGATHRACRECARTRESARQQRIRAAKKAA